ncbi:MAG: enolase C-terminal domain-like protein, partial [Planctomycetota bacterium]
QKRTWVRYSTTITSETIAAARKSAIKMRLYGFRQCKVKVGVRGDNDALRLKMLRRWLGRRMDIRVDANEAWHADEAITQIKSLAPANVSCVEQPIAHADFDALPDVRRECGLPIMLDESLTGVVDAQIAIDSGACDLFNIRLSKCGGMIASLRLAAMAKRAGLGYQLGCHPGETPLLSAAGRHFAVGVSDVSYLEGSYDRHLISASFARPDITFGYGGRAPVINRPGLGIEVDPSVIRRHAIGDMIVGASANHG